MIYLNSFGTTYEKHSEYTLKITDRHFSSLSSFYWFMVANLRPKKFYNKQLLNEAEYRLKIYGNRGGCTASADNTLRYLHRRITRVTFWDLHILIKVFRLYESRIQFPKIKL